MPGIIETLMREFSQDPHVQETGFYRAICERAQFWDAQAEHLGGDIAVAIREAARQVLSVPPVVPFVLSPPTPLQFDMSILNQATQILGTAPLEVRRRFSDMACGPRGVITLHREAMDSLTALSGMADSPVVQAAIRLSDNLGSTAREVSAWGNRIGEGMDGIARLPLPEGVRNFLENVRGVVGHVAAGPAHVDTVMQGLWGSAEAAVAGADLQNRLRELNTQLRTAVDPTIQATIRQQMTEATNQAAGLVNTAAIGDTLNGVRCGFQALSQITSLLGDEHQRLANDIAVVGEAVVSIVGSVATLIAGSAAGGPAAPFIAIAGALGMLAARLFSGDSPSPEAVIMQQIARLSQHMDQRFDRIEVMLVQAVNYLARHMDRRFTALADHVDNRFNRIEEMLQYMTGNMLEQFAAVHRDAAANHQILVDRLRGIAERIDHVHRDLVVHNNELYRESNYRPIRAAALSTVVPVGGENANLLYQQYWREIVRWTTENSRSAITTGNPNPVDMLDRVRLLGAYSNIAAITNRAVDLTRSASQPADRIQAPRTLLANPVIWAEGARTLMRYLNLRSTDLYRLIRDVNGSTISGDISHIKSCGEDIQSFMQQVQRNQPLFDRLIARYETALRAVMNESYRLTVDTNGVGPEGTPSDGPEDAIDHAEKMKTIKSFLEREFPEMRAMAAKPHIRNVVPRALQVSHAGVLRAIGGLVTRVGLHNRGDGSMIRVSNLMNNHHKSMFRSMEANGSPYDPSYNDGFSDIARIYEPTILPMLRNLDNQRTADAAAAAHRENSHLQKMRDLRDEYRCLAGVESIAEGPVRPSVRPGRSSWCSSHRPSRENQDFAEAVAAEEERIAAEVARRAELNAAAERYRNERIKSILAHAAVREYIASRAERRLYHRGLMEGYFGIRDRQELNASLGRIVTRANDRAGVDFVTTLDPLITNLQDAFDELATFIGFAFPHQFMTDPSLQAFLNTLWNRDRCEEYLLADRDPVAQRDFVCIGLQKSLEEQRELACFKQHMTWLVTEATVNPQAYKHPLVSAVLTELGSCQAAVRLATAPVTARMHAINEALLAAARQAPAFPMAAVALNGPGFFQAALQPAQAPAHIPVINPQQPARVAAANELRG